MQTNIPVIVVPGGNETREKYFLNNHHKFSKYSKKYKSTDKTQEILSRINQKKTISEHPNHNIIKLSETRKKGKV